MSPPPENSPSDLSPAAHQVGSRPQEFSLDERTQLLGLAHHAIQSELAHRELRLASPPGHFSEPRGVFTTLYLSHHLRGCVGYVSPIVPLYQAVVETAQAAAFQDQRFSPVTEQEEPHLSISLSVLSRLQMVSAEEVEIGNHGVVISLHGRRGLLLPQVPVEHHWDRETFLSQTCMKAGLPPDAWQKGANIEVFTAEVFGENGHE
jgi:AmmeMemoRadiSam system protein A